MSELTNEDYLELARLCKEKQHQDYLAGLKTPVTIKCVVCDVEIPNSFPDHADNDKLAEEYANHSSFSNGAVGTISFGYGSRFDTDVFIIGICEDCYAKKLATNQVLFTRSYMP